MEKTFNCCKNLLKYNPELKFYLAADRISTVKNFSSTFGEKLVHLEDINIVHSGQYLEGNKKKFKCLNNKFIILIKNRRI